jgi:hypothetical protein
MINHELLKQAKQRLEKTAAVPMGPMPAPPPPGAMPPGGGMPPPGMDPAMMGGAPPMDPSMMGGAPPMDPSMMGGGMPPVDPATGMPIDPATGMPMDPSMMGGAPPMDPAMMGGAPPMEGTPLTVEALTEILPQILDEWDASKKEEPTKQDLANRVDDLEGQMLEIANAVGLTPDVPPEEVGVTGEDTDMEVPPEEGGGVVGEGMTEEAMEAAAQPPMDPAMMGGAPPMPPGGAPPMDPAMMGGAPPMPPQGMPVMASERRMHRNSVGRIQDLVGKLKRG